MKEAVSETPNGIRAKIELTTEQRCRLELVMRELEELPTPELIVTAVGLCCREPLTETGRNRMRAAMSGAIAAQRVLVYLDWLRHLEGERKQIGASISDLSAEARRLISIRSAEAAGPTTLANHLSGHQEVAYHLFAVVTGRIERLLPIAARAAGHKLPKEDRDLLRSFRVLRNYYEHLEDYLPHSNSPKHDCVSVVTEFETENEFKIRLGYEIDDQERIVIGGEAIDVTARGLAEVEEVIVRNWEALKPAAISMVKATLETTPLEIPDPATIEYVPLISLGRSIRNPLGSELFESRT